MLAPFVAAELGAVLTDEPALAVAGGHPVAYEFVIFNPLVGQGQWNDQPILDAIMAQRFSLLILTIAFDTPVAQARWSPSLIAALRASYVPVGTLEGYSLFRPVFGEERSAQIFSVTVRQPCLARGSRSLTTG